MSAKFHKRTSLSEEEVPSKVQKSDEDVLRHGSYQQYYEYRSQDTRPQYIESCLPECLKRLEPGKDVFMLDIGCNSGKLTQELYKKWQDACPERQVHGLGVDIDQALVDKATAEYGSEFLEFAQMDISMVWNSKGTNHIKSYMAKKDIKRFDFICCFSILMYIHLNRGDEGLRRVLNYLCSRTELLVLELQGWKKYRDHARRMRRGGGGEYEHYSTITWRGSNGYLEEQISDYVVSRGFSIICNTSEKNEFNRDVVIYARNKGE